jgi:hypothetical protein
MVELVACRFTILKLQLLPEAARFSIACFRVSDIRLVIDRPALCCMRSASEAEDAQAPSLRPSSMLCAALVILVLQFDEFFSIHGPIKHGFFAC